MHETKIGDIRSADNKYLYAVSMSTKIFWPCILQVLTLCHTWVGIATKLQSGQLWSVHLNLLCWCFQTRQIEQQCLSYEWLFQVFNHLFYDGFFHTYYTISMGLLIVYFKRSTVLSLKVVLILANSPDPDEMQHYAAFHLGLHCLPIWYGTRLGVSSKQKINCMTIDVISHALSVNFWKALICI